MSDAFLGIGEDKEILWVSCGKEGIIERAYMYRVLYIHTYIISIYVYICHVYMNKIWSAVSIAIYHNISYLFVGIVKKIRDCTEWLGRP